jgi:hypothetical protein
MHTCTLLIVWFDGLLCLRGLCWCPAIRQPGLRGLHWTLEVTMTTIKTCYQLWQNHRHRHTFSPCCQTLTVSVLPPTECAPCCSSTLHLPYKSLMRLLRPQPSSSIPLVVSPNRHTPMPTSTAVELLLQCCSSTRDLRRSKIILAPPVQFMPTRPVKYYRIACVPTATFHANLQLCSLPPPGAIALTAALRLQHQSLPAAIGSGSSSSSSTHMFGSGPLQATVHTATDIHRNRALQPARTQVRRHLAAHTHSCCIKTSMQQNPTSNIHKISGKNPSPG